MKPPKYFYFRIKTDSKASKIILEDASGCDVVEVVRCKDCEYFDTDAWRTVDGVPLIVAHNVCRKWAGGCMTEPNGYCSSGTRRKHERTN